MKASAAAAVGLLVSLVTLAAAQSDEAFESCGKQCSDYDRWGYDCAQRKGCFQKQATDQDAFVSCYRECNAGATVCQELCYEGFEDITATCKEGCDEASIMDVFCEENCFEDAFEDRYGNMLPELTDQDVGIWQGVDDLVTRDDDIDVDDIVDGPDDPDDADDEDPEDED